jgi:(p)ppGpp synthase/HD superfamily hydrolase
MAERELKKPLSNRFSNAVLLACKLHRTQARKGTEIPYVSHLLSVAGLALEHGATEDEAIAAVLHDAVEDQGGARRAAQIRARFGPRVATIVLGCTDTVQDPKPPWRARKEAYVRHIGSASRSIRLVSVCDKLHNARAILADYREHGDELWARFTGGREGTLWYYRSLVTSFSKAARPSEKGMARAVAELERVVAELEALSAGRAAKLGMVARRFRPIR